MIEDVSSIGLEKFLYILKNVGINPSLIVNKNIQTKLRGISTDKHTRRDISIPLVFQDTIEGSRSLKTKQDPQQLPSISTSDNEVSSDGYSTEPDLSVPSPVKNTYKRKRTSEAVETLEIPYKLRSISSRNGHKWRKL